MKFILIKQVVEQPPIVLFVLIQMTHLCFLENCVQMNMQLKREPRPLPTMKLNPSVTNIFDFRFEDFTLENYDPHPHIKGKVAV